MSIESWQRFVRGETSPEVEVQILDSWRRSRKAGVDHHTPVFREIPELELERRVATHASTVDALVPHLTWLSSTMGAVQHVAGIVDRDGIVLWATGTPSLVDRMRIKRGIDWSEQSMGTNGAGTALATGHPIIVRNSQHYCRAWHDVSGVAAPVHDAAGEQIAALELVTEAADVGTGHLLAMRHIAHVLDSELARAQAEVARVAAERTAIARNELLELVSHHLRSPLARVTTSSEILCEMLETGAPAEPVLRHSRPINDAAQRMAALVRNLLEASRLEAGSVPITRRAVPMRELLDELAAGLDASVHLRGQRVDVRCDEALVAWCDRDLTAVALANLVENALKFSPEGTTITIRAQRERANAHICIIDQGPGIEPGELARVFERYYQGGASRREGIGLGLYLARSLIESQSGAIRAESRLGHGSEFCCELPLAD